MGKINAEVIANVGHNSQIDYSGYASIEQTKSLIAAARAVFAFNSISEFPIPGKDCSLYIDLSSYLMYYYDSRTAMYVPISGGGGSASEVKITRHTESDWVNVYNYYVPTVNEIIIYTDKHTVAGTVINGPGMKLGASNAYVGDIPFINDAEVSMTISHINNSAIHVSTNDREKWNNQLKCDVSGETLVLTY